LVIRLGCDLGFSAEVAVEDAVEVAAEVGGWGSELGTGSLQLEVAHA